ncbi:amidohydrolase [Hyalangium rubrum]|uniref:Amidohydrolase n=1 Tax=Hyalangium rubrum TaxID=3103134 RepID=A0ABU5GWF8_9BACT|nr:amidohydrolase [Hyalangium sp. s54d21]MDY7225431.1 amidohydrolase [Hyalangium sp. s54d21]
MRSLKTLLSRTSHRLGVLAITASLFGACSHTASTTRGETHADLILHHGKVVTLDAENRIASAIAIRDGNVLAVGSDAEVERYRTGETQVIDLGGRTVIPGLNDSHIHVIRGGLNYNLELRWEGVPSLAKALELVRLQADRTPAGQWVRVVGGWSEFQFAERRLPTVAELNAAAPKTPVFVLYLYGKALLNQEALRVLGITKDTPNPPGGVIERDAQGNPTGMLVAKPDAFILYSTLGRLPKLSPEEQVNSTRQFMRELNRLGVTSTIDAGGGGQNFPDDYAVGTELAKRGELTLRIAYYLFAQKRGQELQDYQRWSTMTRPGTNADLLRPNGYEMEGAGENVLWEAADFENFLEPRPDLQAGMEPKLEEILSLFAEKGWPFRIHATYDESISRILDVIERVKEKRGLENLRFIIDHAETISERNLARVAKLGGGIAVQDRMAFQGEHFITRYGKEAASHTPPVKRMLELGIPVGLGTDATRVSSYNLWLSLHWLVSGKTLGGTALNAPEARLDRVTALRLATVGSAWFSGEEKLKGTLEPGRYADLAVLSGDYLSVPEDDIKSLESVLTVVGGKVVFAAGDFAPLGPAAAPAQPAWSPVSLPRN